MVSVEFPVVLAAKLIEGALAETAEGVPLIELTLVANETVPVKLVAVRLRLNCVLELLDRFTKREICPIGAQQLVTRRAFTLDAPLLILHGIVGEMPGTSALDATRNPKRHLEHVAPLGLHKIISAIVFLCLLLFRHDKRGPL
jgi:hypothetical protein